MFSSLNDSIIQLLMLDEISQSHEFHLFVQLLSYELKSRTDEHHMLSSVGRKHLNAAEMSSVN